MMPSHIDRTLRLISESCCADEQLEQYARGTLPPTHSAWVAMHLEECELCRARTLLSEASSPPASFGERLRTAWLDVVDTICLDVGDTGFQLRTGGLTPIFAEPTLFEGVKILAGVLELQLGEHKTLELRVERASTSTVLVKLTALEPLSAVVEVRDANGARHARQRLDDVTEFELGAQVWTLYLRLQDDGAELTIPIHVSTVASP
jgi:hypothetical protein